MQRDYEQDPAEQKPGRPAWVLGVFAVALVVGAIVFALLLAGCNGQVSSCQRRDSNANCLDPTPSPSPETAPTPTPAVCSPGGCPMILTIVRIADHPETALVTVFPPGPVDLWVNGLPRAYPQGIAFVAVGDLVQACRCCGCSVPYFVT